jgi:hypothetical protein
MISGTCFGYAVDSALPFAYLRDAERAERISVRLGAEQGARPRDAPALRWRPRPGRRWSADLYRRGDGFALSIAGAGWYEVNPTTRRILVPEGTEDVVRREERVWGIPTLLCFARRGDLPLHAAAVEVDGHAVVLAGPGCAGKTTLAAAFVAAGHRLLSEDLCCLRSGVAWNVVPGPAMLRLRRDVTNAVRLPGADAVGIDEDRVHFALARSGRGGCKPVPLAAVLLLRESSEGISLRRLEPARALPDLWALSFRLPQHDDRERCFAGVAALANAVPILDLARPLSLDTLGRTVERVEEAI